MSKLALACSILFAIVAGQAGGATAGPMTLKDCVAAAVEHSPQLSSGRHMSAAYAQAIKKTRATTLPYFSSQLQAYEINGNPATQWFPLGIFQPENGAPGQQNRTAHWGAVGIEEIGVTYPLIFEGSFLGMNDVPAVAAARAQMTEQEAANLIAEQKVILDVVTDYVYAATYLKESQLEQQIVDLESKQLEIVQEQVRLGLKLPQQEAITRAQIEAATSVRKSADENARNFMVTLAMLMGSSKGDQKIELAGELPSLAELPPLERFLDQVMPGHPALRVQSAKVEVAKQQLRVDEANFWPTANFNTNLTAAQDLEYFNGNNQHPRPTAFMSYLTVNVPLYDFGQRRAAISESKETVLSQQDAVKQAELDIRTSISQAYNDVHQDDEILAGLKGNVVVADQALELAEAEHDEGQIDQLALVSAQLTALQQKAVTEIAELPERLKYAELQNLSAGTWHWAP
jgi:outer membrane protein TolC